MSTGCWADGEIGAIGAVGNRALQMHPAGGTIKSGTRRGRGPRPTGHLLGRVN